MNDPHRNDDVKMSSSSSSSSNYSDLLPLVATVLNDKVAADAHDEINSLRRRNAILSSVNIMQQRSYSTDNTDNNREDNAHDDDDVTIASAQFQNGWFENNARGWFGTNAVLWRVDFNSLPPFPCRLADLQSCYVNAGGGFSVADFSDRETFEELWEFSGNAATSVIEKYDGDNTKHVSFVMGNGERRRFWLSAVVHGWPREHWKDAMIEMRDYVEHDGGMYDSHTNVDYLVEVIAAKFPNATMEFLDVAFDISSMRGAFRKLIPDRRMLEAVAERDGRAFKKPKVEVSKTLATNTTR